MNLATGSSELSAEDIVDARGWGCILIPIGYSEEIVLINVSSNIFHLKCHWMLIPSASIWELKSSPNIIVLTFIPLNRNMSLLPLRLL